MQNLPDQIEQMLNSRFEMASVQVDNLRPVPERAGAAYGDSSPEMPRHEVKINDLFAEQYEIAEGDLHSADHGGK